MGKAKTHEEKPMQWSLVAGVIVLFAASAGSFGFAQMTRTTVAIEKMELGQTPQDFDFGRTGQGTPGKWRVVEDVTASGGRAIEQASTDRTDHRFPLAIYQRIV